MRHRWLVPFAATGALVAVAPAVYCAEYASVENAQKAAFPDATAFEPVLLASEAKQAIARDAGRFAVEPRIFRVRRGAELEGWFLVDDVIGKQLFITYALALDAKGSVRSVDILTYRESHGDAIRVESWRGQFVGKRATDLVRLDDDIRNISGATLSCRHVTEGIHRLLLLYERALKTS